MKRFVIILFLVSQSFFASAQSDTTLGYPSEKLGYIFTIGLNYSLPKHPATGFTFGVGTEHFLTEQLCLRPQLFASFISQRYDNDYYVETSVFEIPLHMIYRPFEWKFVPFVSGGGCYKIDVSRLSAQLFAEAAIGVERDFGYSSLAPEIRYSMGKDMQLIYFVMNFKF